MRQIAQRHVAHTARQLGQLVGQALGCGPVEAHYDDVADRLSREHSLTFTIEAEAITGEEELGNVPSAVRHQFADPHRAGDDFEPAICAIALGVDFLVTAEAAAATDPFERDQFVELAGLSDGNVGCMRLAEKFARTINAELPEHFFLHPLWDREGE
ncbi:MAG TPA: hypothetical protein VME45_17430 [Stellaceae bacterium]|nr:hypothetical protein [Stellaceae bacterium]